MSDIKLGITLFSLAHPYLHRRLDLEGCLAICHDLGYEGIEIVSAQMVENYPYPDEEWCRKFMEMTDRYNLETYCYGSYVDMFRFPGRKLTEDEIFQTALADLIVAQKLGFKCFKSQCSMPVSVIERLLPIAKSMGIWFGFELHAPNNCHDEIWTQLFKVFDQYGPDHIGCVPDTGIFAGKPNKLFLNRALAQGVTGERLEMMKGMHADKLTLAQASAEMGTMTEKEQHILSEMYREFNPVPFEDLEMMIPYSRYMHGKFFYINESLEDESVDFKEVVRVAKACGYKGAIAAEYEGYFIDADEDSVKQVSRYAEMMKTLIH